MKKIRGRPFQPGNKLGQGRPKGSRNTATLEAQQLLAENAKAITTKCILLAMQGDKIALRLCMERIAAPRRDVNVRFPFTPVKTAADVHAAMERTLQLIATGRLTPAEGELLTRILESRRMAIETVQMEERIAKLEENAAQGVTR